MLIKFCVWYSMGCSRYCNICHNWALHRSQNLSCTCARSYWISIKEIYLFKYLDLAHPQLGITPLPQGMRLVSHHQRVCSSSNDVPDNGRTDDKSDFGNPLSPLLALHEDPVVGIAFHPLSLAGITFSFRDVESKYWYSENNSLTTHVLLTSYSMCNTNGARSRDLLLACLILYQLNYLGCQYRVNSSCGSVTNC